MSARDTLTAELRAEVLHLEDDLRARVTSQPDVEAAWREEYEASRASERTSATWEAWVDERVTLAVVAWALTTVFVRFCEDNDLVKPVWITHEGGRHAEALDAQQHFLREAARTNPDVTDREWLLEAVGYLRRVQATAGLVDENSPMWLVQPSGDAATRLLDFWRERGDNGALLRDLADPDLDTRFLGDLYQDISEDAQKRYALLQTPVFVEEFILDRTLEPSLKERPLEGFKAIDPTCGSGHFLLGIFHRLLDRWHSKAPNMDERERVQVALDAVHGVDINPFAVSIARFRLTVAALQACGMTSLEQAPAFKYHLAAGDSLLHGLDQAELDLGVDMAADRVAANFAYATENLTALKRILRNGQYDCVVGNPPYITVKDNALNKAYRSRYETCHRKYALSVPFMERLFKLAKAGKSAGWVGQITSNSFMRREFGAPLVEKFLSRTDLKLIVDSSGAWIPGHNSEGTPTVILVGRNSSPAVPSIRAILGVQGERRRPTDMARGDVWSSIVDHIDDPGWSDDWVTVADLDRQVFAVHPWSLAGGGAVELAKQLESVTGRRLNDVTRRIGFFGISGENDAMVLPSYAVARRRLETGYTRKLVIGEDVRDYRATAVGETWFPYTPDHSLVGIDETPNWERHLWPYRARLGGRASFSGGTHEDEGRAWYGWHQLPRDLNASELSIVFAEVATHNHFAIDRGDAAFKQTAPVVKMPGSMPEGDQMGLLGVLNSSTVCFFLRNSCYSKDGGSSWSDRFQFNGANVGDIPLPGSLPIGRGKKLDVLACAVAKGSPETAIQGGSPSSEALERSRVEYETGRAKLIGQHEELDWEVYRLYGLVDEDLTYHGDDLPELSLGERSFEIALARKVEAGDEGPEWFERHGSTPITEIPERWPASYQELVQRRIDAIESNQFISLLERPEHKRRWVTESWEKQEERALRGWLLDRLEDRKLWFDGHGRPIPQSVATLADEVSRDDNMASVLALWEGRPDVPVAKSVESLLAKEAVPYLAAYRYKDSGLRKRTDWESTWELQRREDAGTYNPAPKEHGGDGPIPVPPKYKSSDFRKTEYWAHRGKLDVPKERFILYPDAGRETDPTPVLGWAGWDHAEQALAIATLIQQRESDGWDDERLVPLVAGLAEVLPWVQQWHDEPDDRFGGANLAEFMSEQLEERMTQVEATADQLKAWRPAPAKKGRKAKA